jgi:hypothetical protein
LTIFSCPVLQPCHVWPWTNMDKLSMTYFSMISWNKSTACFLKIRGQGVHYSMCNRPLNKNLLQTVRPQFFDDDPLRWYLWYFGQIKSGWNGQTKWRCTRKIRQ